MGELADDVADMFREGDYRRSAPHLRYGLIDRIAALEAQVASYATAIDEAASVMATFTDAMTGTEDVSRRAMLLDYVPASRLADAEQRAAAAWAAVTRLVKAPAGDSGYACVGVHQGSPERIRRWDKPSDNLVAASIAAGDPPGALEHYAYKPQLCITVVFAVNAPANPDLLERASVELAEAYQRQKAEEQRQAEQAADAKENAVFRATPKDPDADAVTFTMRTTP